MLLPGWLVDLCQYPNSTVLRPEHPNVYPQRSYLRDVLPLRLRSSCGWANEHCTDGSARVSRLKADHLEDERIPDSVKIPEMVLLAAIGRLDTS